MSPRFLTQEFHDDYRWLSAVYESIQPPTSRGKLIWKRLGAKTTDIIQDHVKVLEIQNDLESLVVDGKILESIKEEKPQNPKIIELKITRRLRRHHDNPKFIQLGERVEKSNAKYEKGLIDSTEYLKELLEIAKDLVAAEQEEKFKKPSKLDEKEALTRIFDESQVKKDPEIIRQIVIDIDEIVKKVRFEGWQFTISGEREIKQEITRVLLKHKLHKDKELFQKIYDYVKQHY